MYSFVLWVILKTFLGKKKKKRMWKTTQKKCIALPVIHGEHSCKYSPGQGGTDRQTHPHSPSHHKSLLPPKRTY